MRISLPPLRPLHEPMEAHPRLPSLHEALSITDERSQQTMHKSASKTHSDNYLGDDETRLASASHIPAVQTAVTPPKTAPRASTCPMRSSSRKRRALNHAQDVRPDQVKVPTASDTVTGLADPTLSWADFVSLFRQVCALHSI